MRRKPLPQSTVSPASNLTSRKEDASTKDESHSLRDSLTSRRRNRRCACVRRLIYNWWLIEVLCVALSLVCLIGIIITFIVCDNKPVPSLRFGITFNAVIAALITTAKGSMLLAVAEAIGQLKWRWIRRTHRPLRDLNTFDIASRGPLGSITFLTTIKWRSVTESFMLLVSPECADRCSGALHQLVP